jgi:hypothetical protein
MEQCNHKWLGFYPTPGFMQGTICEKCGEMNFDGKLEEPEKQSGTKHDQSKADLSLIPLIAEIEMARAFMVGEKKYSRYDYYKGHKASQLIAAAKRHLGAWMNGEERCPVDGQHHLGSVMACCAMILKEQELGTLEDNRYKP